VGIRSGVVVLTAGALLALLSCEMSEHAHAPTADAVSLTESPVGAERGGHAREPTFLESWRASVSADPPGGSYAAGRAAFRTRLTRHGAAPQAGGDPPDGVDVVRYPSHGRMLEAWLSRPASRWSHPALVYCHGGFVLTAFDVDVVQAFRAAGFVVMFPALRGENGNPGDFELFLGEVDDAAAAVRWVADQEYVDSERVYAFGHSAGGGVTSQLSLVEDLPLVHTGSSGGLYDPEVFMEWSDFAPFDASDVAEVRWRLLVGNIRHMQRPHVAYIGTQDDWFRRALDLADEEQSESQAPLTLELIRGDHGSSLRPAVQAYLEVILSETPTR
jgi:acetyl esterase/lipase